MQALFLGLTCLNPPRRGAELPLCLAHVGVSPVSAPCSEEGEGVPDRVSVRPVYLPVYILPLFVMSCLFLGESFVGGGAPPCSTPLLRASNPPRR